MLVVNNNFSSVQWRYCIRLENLDSEVVQLRERHWRIFSLSGTLETVRGRGVVGRVGIVQQRANEICGIENRQWGKKKKVRFLFGVS